jgi:hypothetical protein
MTLLDQSVALAREDEGTRTQTLPRILERLKHLNPPEGPYEFDYSENDVTQTLAELLVSGNFLNLPDVFDMKEVRQPFKEALRKFMISNEVDSLNKSVLYEELNKVPQPVPHTLFKLLWEIIDELNEELASGK